MRIGSDGEKILFDVYDYYYAFLLFPLTAGLIGLCYYFELDRFCCKCKGRLKNEKLFFIFNSQDPEEPQTDVNELIVREEEQIERELRDQWQRSDQIRRTQRLQEVWPARGMYEAQLEKIRNVNSKQGE